MTTKAELYARFLEKLRDIETVRSINALLSWDQQVFLPPRGQAARAEQTTLIARLAHEKLVSNEVADLLHSLEQKMSDLTADEAAVVRETRRVHDREKKLPARLVEELSRSFAQGYEAWELAKTGGNYALFAPCLQQNVRLQREAAAHYGYVDEPYDALLEEHEPGMTTRQLDMMFRQFTDAVVPLLQRIPASRSSRPLPLKGKFSRQDQVLLVTRLVEALGFDFQAGRLDAAAHPFTTQIDPTDVRLASWFLESDPLFSIRAALHETGHGLYRQGFESQHRGTPLASIASKGIDESQARFWENMIGRSLAFWRYFWPQFTAAFPEVGNEASISQVYHHINRIQPGARRVEADEVTYNLHIIVRFDLERELLNQRIDVGDLPHLWNERMQKYLGLTPANDVEGVLQDPHWSDGYFGYFPSYALGNLYAAQLHEALHQDHPDLENLIVSGNFRPIMEWLRKKIHRHGMRYRSAQLMELATGSPPSSRAFVRYLHTKYAA